MKRTDFVDNDIIKMHKVIGKARVGNGAEPPASEDTSMSDELPLQSLHDPGEGRMAKQREEVNTGVVKTINEIEILRRRQQELEQKKSDLEDLAQKQEQYDRGKREMIEHLNEGIIALEKKEVQSAQLTELLVATRERFKEALEELESLDEEQWPDEQFQVELYKALVIVEDARMEYSKALAKIEILEGNRDTILEMRAPAGGASGRPQDAPRSFGYWVKIGFALSLPAMILLAVLLTGYLALILLNWI